ncbi:MAG: S41 family peptidase [Patescibacteria group bacterium]
MRGGLLKKITQFVAVAVLFLWAGYFFGRASVPASNSVSGVTGMNEGKPENIDFEPFWEAWSILDEKYSGGGETTQDEKVWGAISGLADSFGDPYTVFMPPEEASLFEEMIRGSFGGVGMEIGEKEGTIVVIAPLKDTPAERAGIQSGDYVVSIDGESTSGLTVDEAVKRIRGEEGTEVVLEIAREGADEFLTFTLVRAKIVVPTLKTEVRNNVFILSLYNFDALATMRFKQAMQEFAQSSADRMIIDLRGNPGGFLDAAVDIASYFVPAGDIIVSERSEKDEEQNKEHLSKGYVLPKKPAKIIVLINGGSASASEIVAGALKEHDIATLVGTQSFGKGSVQELIPITFDTSLKVTVAQWYTPDGTSISLEGLAPDVVVETEPGTVGTPDDLQLEKALELVAQ